MQINFSGARKSLAAALVCVCLLSCGSQDPGESVAREAFDALKKKDWTRYKALTITLAEIALSHDKISPFKQKMTYVGSSVRAQEEDQIKNVFDGYCQKDCLKSADLKSLKLTDSADIKNPWSQGECEIPVSKYSAQISGSLSEPVCVVPKFVVTQWHGRFYLLGLQFDQVQETENEPTSGRK